MFLSQDYFTYNVDYKQGHTYNMQLQIKNTNKRILHNKEAVLKYFNHERESHECGTILLLNTGTTKAKGVSLKYNLNHTRAYIIIWEIIVITQKKTSNLFLNVTVFYNFLK